MNHTGNIIDNKLYVFGGANDSHETDNELHVLDLGNKSASSAFPFLLLHYPFLFSLCLFLLIFLS